MEVGSFYGRNCMGFAYARAGRWAPAIVAIEQGADEAERNGEMAQSARLWAQAGNATLAGGDAAKARDDFDAALARGLPDGMEKGEVHLDRRSEEHTSELQSLMRISYAVFCLKKKK